MILKIKRYRLRQLTINVGLLGGLPKKRSLRNLKRGHTSKSAMTKSFKRTRFYRRPNSKTNSRMLIKKSPMNFSQGHSPYPKYKVEHRNSWLQWEARRISPKAHPAMRMTISNKNWRNLNFNFLKRKKVNSNDFRKSVQHYIYKIIRLLIGSIEYSKMNFLNKKQSYSSISD